MYYFINEYLLQKNSSVEHTAMNRVKLFTHYKTPAKIVTKIYDRLLHQTIGKFGVADNQVMNMFDYFQGLTNLGTPRFITTDKLNLPIEYEVNVGANFSGVFDGDRLIANVGFIPATIGRVFYQEFFDQLGNRVGTDLWDWRGFRSATQYFGQNGQLISQRYYRADGQTAIEEYFTQDTEGKSLPSRMILKDYQGEGDRFFQNSDDLFTFFLNELSKQDSEQTTFIVDRPGTGVTPLLALNDNSRKYVYVPINHTVSPNDPIHADLDGFLAPAFEHFSHFDGFITGTPQQATNLRTRFPKAPIFSIPAVTTLPTSKEETVEMAPSKRLPHSVIYVGRIAKDKQIEQQLRMFALVKDRVPDATFTLFGYGSAKYVEEMQKLTEELKLTSSVTFKDYVPDLADQYDHYQVMTNMSLADGGPLAMLEAMIHGIPAVSYRFNYGPTDFIADGKDGYLIAPGQALTMADKVVDLLLDDQKLAMFSHAAYVKAHDQWTRRKVWNRWQKELKSE
ncbi:glycosyltransferase [Levilactobacillus fujinensis]|uniref:Glycosyltransferase n=1 Tax=Levilactobacillus fujinensis TaxID=2486024 RepID=A0ABW1TJN8_9LACO|nr:glycosyltransferase [Levilactobacillus fujinensis]